jgi:hypothetical protein
MKHLKPFLLSLCIILSLSGYSKTFPTPISIHVFPPLRLPIIDDVAGMRASYVMGKSDTMYGLDAALIGNSTVKRFGGMALSGGFNYNRGSTFINFFQLAGLVNYNKGEFSGYGLQFASLLNRNKGAGVFFGAQLSVLANINDKGTIVGVGFASYNKVKNIVGVQAGFYNIADRVFGVQLGLVNKAKNLHGIQIGLINFAANGLIPAFPIINIGFW